MQVERRPAMVGRGGGSEDDCASHAQLCDACRVGATQAQEGQWICDATRLSAATVRRVIGERSARGRKFARGAISVQTPGLCPSHTSFPLSSSHHRLLACHRHIAHLLLLLLHEHYAGEWYIKRCFSFLPIGCTAFSPSGRSLCSPTTPLRHPSPSGPPPTSQSSHRR